MTAPFSPRAAGAIALTAAGLGLLTLPFVTAAYGVSDAGSGTDPAWGGELRDAAEPLFTFAAPDRVYSTYGLVYFLVTLGVLLGVLGVRDVRAGGRSGVERWGFRLLGAGLGLNLVGLLTDYTFFEGTIVESIGFAGTLLGVLLMVVGGALLGARWMRDRHAPRMAGVLLFLAAPGFVVLEMLGFGNLPSMPLAWFALTGIPLGLFLLGSATGAPERPAAGT